MDAFQVLADPSRRHIVEALRAGERQVNEIVQSSRIHQSGVSRHLRLLLDSGFVRVRPQGQQRYYSLCPGPFNELEDWLSTYRRVWDARLTRFAEALEKKQGAAAPRKPRKDR